MINLINIHLEIDNGKRSNYKKTCFVKTTLTFTNIVFQNLNKSLLYGYLMIKFN